MSESAREAAIAALKTTLGSLWGLVVEDASLTLGILVWLGVATFALPALGLRDAWGELLLFVLLAIVLLENVRRSAQRAGSTPAAPCRDVSSSVTMRAINVAGKS
jgi:membrane protein implicated in regulation of membrane protease activity